MKKQTWQIVVSIPFSALDRANMKLPLRIQSGGWNIANGIDYEIMRRYKFTSTGSGAGGGLRELFYTKRMSMGWMQKKSSRLIEYLKKEVDRFTVTVSLCSRGNTKLVWELQLTKKGIVTKEYK